MCRACAVRASALPLATISQPCNNHGASQSVNSNNTDVHTNEHREGNMLKKCGTIEGGIDHLAPEQRPKCRGGSLELRGIDYGILGKCHARRKEESHLPVWYPAALAFKHSGVSPHCLNPNLATFTGFHPSTANQSLPTGPSSASELSLAKQAFFFSKAEWRELWTVTSVMRRALAGC
jgi:hypothetical protein